MKHIVLVVGARPNFMKAAPVIRACVAVGIKVTLVHTGQHYDPLMSDVFFQELEIPRPDVNLEVGAGDRITQTGKIIRALVPVLRDVKPDACVVVGDVTSTAAAVLAAVEAEIPVVHIEAGLRSFNWAMPEELNRMIADHHSQVLFTTEPEANKNLKNERVAAEKIHLVGNVMIDTLQRVFPTIDCAASLSRLGLTEKTYGVLTLHRPENVDDPAVLAELWSTIQEVGTRMALVFPVHPRTRGKLPAQSSDAVRLIDPVGYRDMLALVNGAAFVLTDSGGLQEEATVLHVPCITMRPETERLITVSVGTSEIVGRDREKILTAVDRVLRGEWKKGAIPDLWDGHTAERIAEILKKIVVGS